MAGTVEISNLRNIKKLRFEIPDRGVWLVTAGNGAGKTSLLACLRRIGHPNAFPVHFPASLQSDRLDNHSKGSVTYEINGEKVEYAYRGARWTPRPRSNATLFKKFGYPSVTYVGATADRITPRPEDFDTRNVRGADRFVIDAANQIFETNKFSMLRTINLGRGTGNDAFVLAVTTSPNTYHSEKHFSLGELCVLKLLRLLTQVDNNSMIIIDELEMALHPRAQVKMLQYIEYQAQLKNLTIIFSTHSVTLLKIIDKKQIIYLEKQDNEETRSIVGCFPTYAIGNIAADEESLPDILIYVEDVLARDISTAFFEVFVNEKFSDPTERPTVKIVPVGGFQAVVSFLDRNRSVLPPRVRQKALLDADVSNETMKQWKEQSNHAQLEKFQKLKESVSYLPFTPEVGLLDYITENLSAFESKLKERFADNQIRLGTVVAGYDATLKGSARRKSAKVTTAKIIEYLCTRTQRSEDSIQESLSGVFATLTWRQYRPDFLQLFGPMT